MRAATMRWIVGAGALLVAAGAFYVLMNSGGPVDRRGDESLPPLSKPALDEIDAESRAAMRELLRDAGEE